MMEIYNMSEEQQQAAEAATAEATDVTQPDPTELTIETALLFYRNLRFSINENVKKLSSPYHYNNKGQHTSRKKETKKMTDLMSLAVVITAFANDIEPNPDQFESPLAKELYSQLMLVAKSKEVIKADLRAKILAGDESTKGISEELRQKVLKQI